MHLEPIKFMALIIFCGTELKEGISKTQSITNPTALIHLRVNQRNCLKRKTVTDKRKIISYRKEKKADKRRNYKSHRGIWERTP